MFRSVRSVCTIPVRRISSDNCIPSDNGNSNLDSYLRVLTSEDRLFVHNLPDGTNWYHAKDSFGVHGFKPLIQIAKFNGRNLNFGYTDGAYPNVKFDTVNILGVDCPVSYNLPRSSDIRHLVEIRKNNGHSARYNTISQVINSIDFNFRLAITDLPQCKWHDIVDAFAQHGFRVNSTIYSLGGMDLNLASITSPNLNEIKKLRSISIKGVECRIWLDYPPETEVNYVEVEAAPVKPATPFAPIRAANNFSTDFSIFNYSEFDSVEECIAQLELGDRFVVTNIPPSMTWMSIKDAFRSYYGVKCVVDIPEYNGRPMNFAIVDAKGKNRLIPTLDQIQVKSYVLNVTDKLPDVKDVVVYDKPVPYDGNINPNVSFSINTTFIDWRNIKDILKAYKIDCRHVEVREDDTVLSFYSADQKDIAFTLITENPHVFDTVEAIQASAIQI